MVNTPLENFTVNVISISFETVYIYPTEIITMALTVLQSIEWTRKGIDVKKINQCVSSIVKI